MRFYLWQWRWYRKRKGGTWIKTFVPSLMVGPFWQPLHEFEEHGGSTGYMEREEGREVWPDKPSKRKRR